MAKQGRTQHVLALGERTFLAAALTMAAWVADWLLARRLAHDRAQAQRRPPGTH